ncbi:hypothetical protein AJ80_00923 [Polytolypa hystricis UAMH7299]|uniref:Deoxyribonuclease NucA/NucB domain-containing protein n=1 Tax=Polytolypa hystricis (strain UAMH7299) TaxID=1447883 RepID=A0A2B7Z1H4_POLH7|nr:hypothetical protein AJ80_00923 [Polytolypa hystricis UAMH7299]
MASISKLTRLSILITFFFFLTASAATFNWNCAKSAGTCNNFCYYTKCRAGAKKTFTYDSNKRSAAGRRRLSGCSKNPCGAKSKLPFKKFGNSCDEVPFASTKEGGKGGQLRCVRRSENSTKRNCKNDGGQFQLNSRGGFTKNKAVLDSSLEFSMSEESETVTELKEVETEDGTTHLVIAEDPEDPIGVGHNIWDPETDKNVTVVKVLVAGQ